MLVFISAERLCRYAQCLRLWKPSCRRTAFLRPAAVEQEPLQRKEVPEPAVERTSCRRAVSLLVLPFPSESSPNPLLRLAAFYCSSSSPK